MNTQTQLDLDFVRNQFPALSRDFIYMDNAGGSQVLQGVIQRITHYLSTSNVQLGASYQIAKESDALVDEATRALAKYIGASRKEEIVVGPSTTMLFRILSLTLSTQWAAGDEIIVSNSDHEANVSCWMDLRKKGIVVKIWKINPDTLRFELNDLQKLLSSKTKLVTLVHASNVLGTINPIKEIAKAVHQAGALICVDGVAFAPHRKINVQEWDVDFYAFSTYKWYGPHQSVLYGKYHLLKELESINHYFIGKEQVPYKLQPGNFNFELTYSLGAIPQYFEDLYAHHFPEEKELASAQKISRSFELIATHEEKLVQTLLEYLNAKPQVKIIGETSWDKNKRVPTLSFVHEKLKSSYIVEQVDPFGIGIRFGDFYAKKLIEDLGLVEKEGVVRVSLVHYNTVEEVEKLIAAFEHIF